MNAFHNIWRDAMVHHLQQASYSLGRLGQFGSQSYLIGVADLGDAQTTWEAVLESDRICRAVRAGQVACQVGMSALRHRAVQEARRA